MEVPPGGHEPTTTEFETAEERRQRDEAAEDAGFEPPVLAGPAQPSWSAGGSHAHPLS